MFGFPLLAEITGNMNVALTAVAVAISIGAIGTRCAALPHRLA